MTASRKQARKPVRKPVQKKGRKPVRKPAHKDLGGRITVDLGERSYPVRIGHDTLSEAGAEIAQRTGARRVAIVTVPAVGRRYAARLARSLADAGVDVKRIVVPEGDATKNLQQVARLYDAFLEAGLDRSSAVIALGGGMVGDLAGFAAASYLRGIAFVQVPTTVLAMVDASIGGKTGVNLEQGKNLVGAFHQPKLVWIDTATLASLPMRERAAGMAEAVKAGAIWDAKLFGRLELQIEEALALEPDALVPVLQRACAIKAEVVSRDEREGGLRMLLNFGHTLGHVVEKEARYEGVLHGEAVSMGMVYAAKRSEELGYAPAGTRDRLEDLLLRCALPTELPSFPRRAYLSGLRVDKKKVDAAINFVVLRELGRAETVSLSPEQIFPPRRTRTRRS
ncbi:MAG: 3-dehydroquinate synthase [Deltaproteobacteria bacterium]|nr:3-dehydroquinate synthase [Deltaproteobacteria bacterium]